MTTAPSPAGHALGLRSLHEEVSVPELEVEGELPSWLAGTLLRNGPARWELPEQRLAHWFDGLAMLHRFTFEDGRVSYANRFLRGRAHQAAESQGKLGYREFASDPCKSLFQHSSTDFAALVTDNANVALTRIGDRFVAMTETPLSIVFDPATLETLGSGPPPPGVLTTAHPHADRATGEQVSYAIDFTDGFRYVIYALEPDGGTREIASCDAGMAPSYMHSFALTERFAVVAACPFVVQPLELLTSGRPFIENYRWEPERPSRFFVFDRADGELAGTWEAEPFFHFHHVNAWEEDGSLVLDLLAYEDASVIDALRIDAIRTSMDVPPARLTRFTLDLSGSGVRSERLLDDTFELPRIDYERRNGLPYRYAYGAAGAAGGGSDWDGARIVKADVERRTAAGWSAPESHPGEPVFVPEPGAEAEDGGVLLSVVLDAERESSYLLVLDAATLEERARAWAPHVVPFGFHGNFYGRSG